MKGSEFNEKNVSAQKEARSDGARIQKKNVNKGRKKGFGSPPRKGQKKTLLLKCASADFKGVLRLIFRCINNAAVSLYTEKKFCIRKVRAHLNLRAVLLIGSKGMVL